MTSFADLAPEDGRRIHDFIAKTRWHFAHTMPQAPHEYTLRKNCFSDRDFAWFVKFIRDHGYGGTYAGRTYTYLDVDGWSYWTMGEDIDRDGKPHTILINRRRLA
jgi:hypothetical protein